MPDVFEHLKLAFADSYAIERELGSGGMATVYLAEDLKHDRQVAIKVMRPELGTRGYTSDRFLREIRIAAKLTHPQILPLHDSGERDGFLYYVMPYLGSESLRHRIDREKQLPIYEAIRITQAVAGALDYAHRRDVLHRDVKPENILFSEGQPVVADFGVARAISTGAEHLTEGGVAVGTPAYMSPEQASADRDLDRRSDLYSLACVLYEMLAGRSPFAGSNARATMARHAIESVPPIRAIRANVPAAVEQALIKALAKVPADRFATTVEFAAALVAPVSGVTTVPAGLGGPVRSTIAVLPFVNASPDPENEYFSDGMTDELINALANVEGLQVASRTSVFALKGARKDVRSIGSLLDVAAVLEGSVRKAGDRLRMTVQLTNVDDGRLIWSERYDRKLEDTFAIQDEIAASMVKTLRTTLLGDLGDPAPRRYTGNVKAYNLYLRGRYYWNRRPEGIPSAIKYFEEAIAEDSDYALAYTGLSDSYAIQLDYRAVPVEEGMRRAKEEARKALQLDDNLAEAHTSLAWVTFIYDWDWVSAGREFTRAIELNPRYATARQWYAWLLTAMGRFDEALAESHAAVELDPLSPAARRSLGWVHYYGRQYEPALAHLHRAIEMDPTSEETHRVLGLAYMQKGMYDDASAAIREALSLSDESTYALAALGYIEALSGRKGEVQAVLDELNKRAEDRYVSPVAFVTLYVALGNVDEALFWLDRAHEARRGWLVYLNVEPLLDPIRSDSRFAGLVKKMGLA